jgi:ATPase family associated with various cellular activities (AAA)
MKNNLIEKYKQPEGMKGQGDGGVTLREFCEMRKLARTPTKRSESDSSTHELFKIDDWAKLRKVKFTNENLGEKISQIKISQCHRQTIHATELHVQGVVALAEKYKNFADFLLDFVVPQIHLQTLTNEPLKLPNFCLVGEPGIGKSAMLNELSNVLDLDGKIFDASAIQASHVLNGLSRHYTSADVGLIFNAMLLETNSTTSLPRPANTLFCIDEIEKVGRSNQYGAVLDLLLPLLEGGTAKRFTDVCIPELPLNLEKLNWCFTSNSTEDLSDALRSRVMEIHVPKPTEEQSMEIASNIFQSEIKKLNGRVNLQPDLAYQELCKLTEYSPRQQKQVLQLAIAKAVREGRDALEIAPCSSKKTFRMGFL